MQQQTASAAAIEDGCVAGKKPRVRVGHSGHKNVITMTRDMGSRVHRAVTWLLMIQLGKEGCLASNGMIGDSANRHLTTKNRYMERAAEGSVRGMLSLFFEQLKKHPFIAS